MKPYNLAKVQYEFFRRINSNRDTYILSEYLPQKIKTAFRNSDIDALYRYAIILTQYLNIDTHNIDDAISKVSNSLIVWTDSNTAESLKNFLNKFYTDDQYRTEYLTKAKMLYADFVKINFTPFELYQFLKWTLNTIDAELSKYEVFIYSEDREELLREALNLFNLKPIDVFVCDRCGKHFTSEKALLNHECISTSNNGNEYKYVCSICGFKTNSLNEFANHKCLKPNETQLEGG